MAGTIHGHERRRGRVARLLLLAPAALVLLGSAAVALPLRYDVHPAAVPIAAGALAIGGGILALVRLRRGRRGWSFVGVLIAITALELAWFGEVVPPLNAYMGGEPFYREARAVLRESGAAPTAPPVASPASPALPLAVCHASLAMTAFYLDHPGPQDWPDAAVVQAKVDEGRRGWLVADPRQVEGVTGLEPVLVRTLRSPFGQTRQLGLYRLPGR